MPIPEPNETEDAYMQRCMAYPDMQKYETSQRAAICHSKYSDAKAKGIFVTEPGSVSYGASHMEEEKPFARFPNMASCKLEMQKLGHAIEDAANICIGIFNRAEKGVLLKGQPTALEVLSKAGEDDIVLGGYAQWEIEDDDGDILTVDAQVKALNRFLNQPPEYQLVTLDHAKGPLVEVKAAHPLLKYTNSTGETFYTHVNEIGTYFISKIRPADGLKSTEFIRSQAKAGKLNGYSVNVLPLEHDAANPKRILDAEYTANTITTKGVMRPRNPRTRNVEVISKGEGCDCDSDVCGGACCTFITQQFPSDNPDARKYFELHGVEVKSDLKGGLFLKLPVPCKEFDAETKACKVHDNRPESCRVYPQRESPFIAKEKCSVLMKAQKKAEIPTLNDVKSSSMDVEGILIKHGFIHPDR